MAHITSDHKQAEFGGEPGIRFYGALFKSGRDYGQVLHAIVRKG